MIIAPDISVPYGARSKLVAAASISQGDQEAVLFVKRYPRILTAIGPKLNRTPQWLLLIGISAALSALLLWLAIPAALLLGPIVAGILVTTNGGAIDVPNRPFVLAQGLVGCMVAKMLPLSIAAAVLGRWPVFVGGALAVIVASALLGLLLSRMKVLPGSTAVWG
jgi:uncharacterized protein